MSVLTRFKYFLWYFSRFKVPMIGYLKPRLLVIDDQRVVVKLPLRRRSKNHLNSMYFGALSVGADLAGGLHGFYYAAKNQLKVSLVFKSFQAQFLRRPESDVYFVCEQGDDVHAMIVESKASGERINKMIRIRALIHYPETPEEVACFDLELSLKVIN
ncbi:PaaI family thioesterase [Legionella spiritensis]|uniref:Aromatic compounds catabolism n=1 Tax=Legionella spiritensis TaxID=452 RepID=A0A0W0Z090_LEGSP|nr:DUF4442 domain-containing protein [Legionella spiritensis]KTD62544.1 aromatic compounds catabolism [Legionella spiritensis]SNV30720.1 aromatic compounds catabolism [Legionella spiritensis]VEG91975.1 aromatic compounds catabolism [Legionella spiritensis]